MIIRIESTTDLRDKMARESKYYSTLQQMLQYFTTGYTVETKDGELFKANTFGYGKHVSDPLLCFFCCNATEKEFTLCCCVRTALCYSGCSYSRGSEQLFITLPCELDVSADRVVILEGEVYHVPEGA